MLYRDLPLVLTPLYPLQIAAFQTIFGESFLALRLLGVVVTCGIACALLDLLRPFFRIWVAVFVAAVATIYYQAFTAFVNYDFTQFVLLYALLAAVFLVRSFEASSDHDHGRGALRLNAVSGLFASFAFLIKQSNGGVVALVLFVVGAACAARLYSPRIAAMRVVAQAAGMALPIFFVAIWLASAGAIPAFLEQTIGAAYAAKGGGNVFGWMLRFYDNAAEQLSDFAVLHNQLIDLLLVAGAVALATQGLVLARARVFSKHALFRSLIPHAWRSNDMYVPQALIVGVIGCGTLCLLSAAAFAHECTVCTSLGTASYAMRAYILVWALNLYLPAVIVAAILFVKLRTGKTAAAVVIAAFSLSIAIGTGMSAGLSELSAFMALSFLFAFLIELWLPLILPAMVIATALIAFIAPYMSAKAETPYSWWYVITPPVRSIGCAPVPNLLQGMCIDPAKAADFERIVTDIRTHSSAKDAVYVYPHMPLFNLLSDRKPYHNAIVSWFDFTTAATANDVDAALNIQPPAVIVFAEIPEFAVAAHERAFGQGRPLPQRKIVATIEVLLKAGRIRQIDRIESLDGVPIDVYART